MLPSIGRVQRERTHTFPFIQLHQQFRLWFDIPADILTREHLISVHNSIKIVVNWSFSWKFSGCPGSVSTLTRSSLDIFSIIFMILGIVSEIRIICLPPPPTSYSFSFPDTSNQCFSNWFKFIFSLFLENCLKWRPVPAYFHLVKVILWI